MTDITIIPFYEDEIVALIHEGKPFVAVRPICERLGLAWQTQHRKLTAPDAHWSVTMMVTETAAGSREALTLAVMDVPLWLATIQPGRVKPELRETLERYQREVKQVLFDHFFGEPAGLRVQNALLVAEVIAARPIYARIRAIQAQGTPRSEAFHALGRSQAASEVLIAQAERLGVIEPSGWTGWGAFDKHWRDLRGSLGARAIEDMEDLHIRTGAILGRPGFEAVEYGSQLRFADMPGLSE